MATLAPWAGRGASGAEAPCGSTIAGAGHAVARRGGRASAHAPRRSLDARADPARRPRGSRLDVPCSPRSPGNGPDSDRIWSAPSSIVPRRHLRRAPSCAPYWASAGAVTRSESQGRPQRGPQDHPAGLLYWRWCHDMCRGGTRADALLWTHRGGRWAGDGRSLGPGGAAAPLPGGSRPDAGRVSRTRRRQRTSGQRPGTGGHPDAPGC